MYLALGSIDKFSFKMKKMSSKIVIGGNLINKEN